MMISVFYCSFCEGREARLLHGAYEVQCEVPMLLKEKFYMFSLLKSVKMEKWNIRAGPYYHQYSYIDSQPFHRPYHVSIKSYGLVLAITRNKPLTHIFNLQMEDDLNFLYNRAVTIYSNNRALNTKLSFINYYGPALFVKFRSNLYLKMDLKLGFGYGTSITSQYPGNADFESFILFYKSSFGVYCFF